MDRSEISKLGLMLQTDQMITLAPEGSDKSFQVPRALLITASPWFQKALDERYQEGQTRVLKLLDTNIETVENFLFWLYHRGHPFRKALEKKDSGGDHDPLREAAIHFWAFGDKHFIPRMKEIAIFTLKSLRASQPASWPSLNIFKLGYTVSPAGSPLRDLLSKVCVDGLKARLAPPPKDTRTRRQRRDSLPAPVVVPQGYTVADFEQIEDTPGLLIDILKAFVPAPFDDEMAPMRECPCGVSQTESFIA